MASLLLDFKYILEAIQGLSKKIDVVEQNVNKKIDTVSEQVTAIQEDVTIIKQDITEIKGSIAYLEDKKAKHDKKIYLIENPIKEA